MTATPRRISNDYSEECASLRRSEWHELLDQFSDASLYQTSPYDVVRGGQQSISHLVLRSEGRVVAAAQVRVVPLGLLPFGAGYVRWGPLWRRREVSTDLESFRMCLRSLRNEYVCRRGLVLRVFPLLFGGDASSRYVNALSDEGYVRAPRVVPQRTLLLDLTVPMEDIRRNLRKTWRQCLTKAEQSGLQIVDGTDDGFFAEFVGLYEQMVRRKRFTPGSDVNQFRGMQRDLPPRHKMRVFLCETSKGAPSAGAVFSALGDMAVYLHGATNEDGLKTNGSHLILWRAIQWMKECGCLSLNLNGINPDKNPGTYVFKKGLAGKAGQELVYSGQFDCYPSRLHFALVRTAGPVLRRLLTIRRRGHRGAALGSRST